MKVVILNTPAQSEQTINPQIIEGNIYYWSVNEEMLKLGETFKQWLDRKLDYIKTHPKFELYYCMGIYDVQVIGPAAYDHTKYGMMVRYQWIKK